MTINSISTIQSTPFCGLGTQTFNVTTAGLYTVAVNVTIPWMTSDQPQAVANPPARQVQTVTTVADVTGSLNDKYFTFYDAGNNNGYYVWLNINSAGTDPEVSGLTGIEVAGATNITANNLATAIRAAINAVDGILVVASGATNAVILTNTGYGACTAAANAAGGSSPGFSYSVGTTGTFGYASGLSVVVEHEDSEVLRLSQPAPTQPLMAGSVQVQASAGDVIEVITSSLSTADAGLNAVKGIINVYLGE